MSSYNGPDVTIARLGKLPTSLPELAPSTEDDERVEIDPAVPDEAQLDRVRSER
jgi:hypothetical protein